ncbi:hypothetical protein KIPB_003713 [Kipferlia bialata]|uniref:Multi antimicrobial extrusion protein n=1 Tax=Kipferlia bialata TaxID=797122 RepID=A0A9K3CUH3_9EUKA|nr:hypothetical protein KIPB_003713 [Kipferlia bialata]|eukprot:g3713.t1
MTCVSESEHGEEPQGAVTTLSESVLETDVTVSAAIADVVEEESKLADGTLRLGTAPLGPLLFWLCFPTAISMSINAIYNLADSFFIGKYTGTVGLTAISLATPLESLFATGSDH